MTLLHATCVAIEGRGVLLLGPPGAGKSNLALRLLDRGAALVSDDQVVVETLSNRLEARAPATISGVMEVRGIGIVEVVATTAPLALAVNLAAPPERMPPDPLPCRDIAGHAVPVIALAPFEASAPLKVELALRRFGLRP